MQIIGLTGGSGTGKSTVAAMLQQHGAGLVDADAVYRRLSCECVPMLDALAQAFGSQILTPEHTLCRPALARIVFHDAQKLDLLGQITTPYIRQASIDAIHAQAQKSIVLYDAPTLFETGAQDLCQGVIGVLAPFAQRLARILSRDKLTPDAAQARLNAQPADAFYRTRCTWIIENNGDLATLEHTCSRLYQTLMQNHANGKE